MNGQQLRALFARKKRGEHFVYHVGLLMRDRLYNIDVESVAATAFQLYSSRRGVLFQRRVDQQNCQYLIYKL